jgi:signal transduction histidine kinase
VSTTLDPNAARDVLCGETTAVNVSDLRAELARETDSRRRAECMCRIQSDTVQLALDLLVREPDIDGFFRAFITTLVEESESLACGVWLLGADNRADCWMAVVGDRFYSKRDPNWDTLALPRDAMSLHLVDHRPGWTLTEDFRGDDARLPDAVRRFNVDNGIASMVVCPLVLPDRNLGWFVLTAADGSECETQWRRALTEAMARQATLALHQSRLSEQSLNEARRQAVLEERNRLARDIHDTLAQGFAAILMQLQAAQRAAGDLTPAAARSLDTAVELARTHMVEARRSVGALRPDTGETEDVCAALQRITDMARRTSGLPVELTIDTLPAFGGGVEREIIGIAQEAVTNAVRHARACRISVQASGIRGVGFRLSVADDGRGIPKERQELGFGLISMRERAERIGASLTIVTAPRSGTEVVLAWEPPAFTIPGQGHVSH